MIDINAFKDRLIAAKVAIPELIAGCSEEEIATLEQQYGQRLPAVYREFLRAMGKEAGALFRGTDMFYRHLPKLRRWGEELFKEQEPQFHLTLPEDAFVFSMHQGYEMLFFLTTEGDDPPVYLYVDGEDGWTRTWDTFSEYLESALKQHAYL